MSRIRAVEHNRTVLSASTSGISGIILPDGTIVAQSGKFVAATYVQSVPLMATTTIATRVGAWPEWIMCAAALVAIMLGILRRPRAPF